MRHIYIGFRIESPEFIKISEQFAKTFNKNNKNKIYDICVGGRIVIERANDIIYAKGLNDIFSSGMVNFSLVVPINNKVNAIRVSKIINVLGNDKIIKERVDTFFNKNSLLNHLPELNGMIDALRKIESKCCGFVKYSNYYAPEMIIYKK